MKIIKKTSDFLEFLNVLQVRGAAADGTVERDVRDILDNVKEKRRQGCIEIYKEI